MPGLYPSDYDLSISLLSQASSIRVTPNTLTETSILLKRINEPARSDISVNLRTLSMCLNVFDEYCIESRLGAGEKEFVR
jgi:hypothetical protein